MELALLKKALLYKFYTAKIAVKRVFYKKDESLDAFSIEQLIKQLEKKYDKIVVLASGPSAKKCVENKRTLYLVTNDGHKMISHSTILYYVKDGFFVRKFLANGPFGNNHQQTLLYWFKENPNDITTFNFFKKNKPILKNQEYYYISNFIGDAEMQKSNFEDFKSFISMKHKMPWKIQNSGIMLLFLGFYLAERMNCSLEIFGFDLGEGGKTHFDGRGHVGESVTRSEVKKNALIYLEEIYQTMGNRVVNHSYFYPKPA